MRGIVEGDYMKNVIYGIMDLFTIGFFVWLIVYTIMNFTNVVWSLPTVMLMIAVVWTAVRFVKIHWYIFKTSKIARKSVRKVINR